MQMFRAECVDCGAQGERAPSPKRARLAMSKHRCVGKPQRCACCGRAFAVLMDDGDLCVMCDAILYPENKAAA